jgi:hypothetical protein
MSPPSSNRALTSSGRFFYVKYLKRSAGNGGVKINMGYNNETPKVYQDALGLLTTTTEKELTWLPSILSPTNQF